MVITDGHRYALASRVRRHTGRYLLEEGYGQSLSAYLSRRPQGRLVPQRRAHLSRGVVRGMMTPSGRKAGYRIVSGTLRVVEYFIRGAEQERRDDERQVRMFLRLAFILLPEDRDLRRMYVSVKMAQGTRRKHKELYELRIRHANTSVHVVRDRQARLSLEAQSLDRSLAQVYRDPVRARQALDGMADRERVEVPVETLASRAWHLGSVLEEERKVWMGLGVRPDRSKAYAAARLDRRAVQSYLEARLRVPGPEELARMEAEVRARSERIADLEHHLDRLPDEGALLRRTAQRASELSPERMKQLTRGLGRETSFGLKREIRRLLERDRGLER